MLLTFRKVGIAHLTLLNSPFLIHRSSFTIPFSPFALFSFLPVLTLLAVASPVTER
jgi:hypothetical protein